MDKELPVLGFAAFSGTGKTSLLKKLIPALKQRNLSVAVIKHAHHDFEIDLPGKDSYELRHAGADQVLISSTKRFVKIMEVDEEIPLLKCIERVSVQRCDLVLVEGYKMAAINKIELHRPALDFPLLYKHDKNIIAIATDQPITDEQDIPVLDLNDIDQIADFVISNLKMLSQPTS